MNLLRISGVIVLSLTILSCEWSNGKKRSPLLDRPIVYHRPDSLENVIRDSIEKYVETFNPSDSGSLSFRYFPILKAVYEQNNFHRIWGRDSLFYERADSFFALIRGAETYGLFPLDYHEVRLKPLMDSLRKKQYHRHAGLWTRADLLLSDAFISFAHDLHLGRIPADSVTLNPDTVVTDEFYRLLFVQLADTLPRAVLEELEPLHPGYRNLKGALPDFLKKMDRTEFTYIHFPVADSNLFQQQLIKRLEEGGYTKGADSLSGKEKLKAVVRKAQQALGLKQDGKPGVLLIRQLNATGPEQFRRIALNMDRYKHFPDSMPPTYILVNLPAFRLSVYDSGKVILESKVIIGKPQTRTPILNSRISNLITYPQWTVPYSIIFKEMLPKIRRDIDYLRRENLMVVDKNDNLVDPYSIDWNKLGKHHFPYLIRQRQGDDNSLGVMKFNFPNRYSVYLHDTNARGLFGRSDRALSHGCVRVQSWDTLARFLLIRDSSSISVARLQEWLDREEKHHIPLRRKVPVYFRYFTSVAKENGSIEFFDDLYGEDNQLMIRFLSRSGPILLKGL